MAGEWVATTIGEQATLQRGFDITKEEQRNGKVPVISSGGISSYHDTVAVKGPGVVLGRKGVVGSVYYVKKDYWPHDTTLWVKDFHGNDPRFVYYFFKSIVRKLGILDVGSANPTLNRNHVHPMEITWPNSIEQQCAISSALGTIDDKIELNRKMNETLEAMARALFKSWFIDFDPVKRNIARSRNQPAPPTPLPVGEGSRRPGEGVVAGSAFDHLFPDSFVDSELGEIPKGWSVGTLGDVSDHPRRTIQSDEIQSTTPYIALEHMPRRAIAIQDWDYGEGLESNKFKFEKGEILFGKLRPYFHKVGVAPVDGVCSTDIVVICPKSEDWFGFVLGHVSSDAFIKYTNAASTGTKMPRTNWGDMANYELVLPSSSIAKAFTKTVRVLTQKIIVSVHESRALASVRDSLLPKLVSGELHVM